MRKIARSVHENARDVARKLAKTPRYAQSRRDRKKVEMLFAHLKGILKLDRRMLRLAQNHCGSAQKSVCRTRKTGLPVCAQCGGLQSGADAQSRTGRMLKARAKGSVRPEIGILEVFGKNQAPDSKVRVTDHPDQHDKR